MSNKLIVLTLFLATLTLPAFSIQDQGSLFFKGRDFPPKKILDVDSNIGQLSIYGGQETYITLNNEHFNSSQILANLVLNCLLNDLPQDISFSPNLYVSTKGVYHYYCKSNSSLMILTPDETYTDLVVYKAFKLDFPEIHETNYFEDTSLFDSYVIVHGVQYSYDGAGRLAKESYVAITDHLYQMIMKQGQIKGDKDEPIVTFLSYKVGSAYGVGDHYDELLQQKTQKVYSFDTNFLKVTKKIYEYKIQNFSDPSLKYFLPSLSMLTYQKGTQGTQGGYDFLLLVSTAYGVVSSQVNSLPNNEFSYSLPTLFPLKRATFKVDLNSISLPHPHEHVFESTKLGESSSLLWSEIPLFQSPSESYCLYYNEETGNISVLDFSSGSPVETQTLFVPIAEDLDAYSLLGFSVDQYTIYLKLGSLANTYQISAVPTQNILSIIDIKTTSNEYSVPYQWGQSLSEGDSIQIIPTGFFKLKLNNQQYHYYEFSPLNVILHSQDSQTSNLFWFFSRKNTQYSLVRYDADQDTQTEVFTGSVPDNKAFNFDNGQLYITGNPSQPSDVNFTVTDGATGAWIVSVATGLNIFFDYSVDPFLLEDDIQNLDIYTNFAEGQVTITGKIENEVFEKTYYISDEFTCNTHNLIAQGFGYLQRVDHQYMSYVQPSDVEQTNLTLINAIDKTAQSQMLNMKGLAYQAIPLSQAASNSNGFAGSPYAQFALLTDNSMINVADMNNGSINSFDSGVDNLNFTEIYRNGQDLGASLAGTYVGENRVYQV